MSVVLSVSDRGFFFVVVSFKYMIILSGHWKLSVIERSPLTLDRCPYFREIRL